MIPALVVIFVQCDRPEYTRRTLDSFVDCARHIEWEGWYADEASRDQSWMMAFTESRGMRPAVIHEKKRVGFSLTAMEVLRKIAGQYDPATMALLLQNDFEFLRPIPIDEARELLDVRPDVGWIRTAGHWNSGMGKHPIPENWIKEIRPAYWDDYRIREEVFEIGDSYFCYNPPPLVPLGTLYYALQGSDHEVKTVWGARETGKLCARFKHNVAIHIGEEVSNGPAILRY